MTESKPTLIVVNDDTVEASIGAALRAAADQVTPGPWKVNSCCDQRERSIRGGLLAIAAELDPNPATPKPNIIQKPQFPAPKKIREDFLP